MHESDSDKLFRFLFQALDHDNARDLETFGQNFLQSGAMWDVIADHFPDAKASEVRRVMMRAFEAWQKAHTDCDCGTGHTH